MTTTTTKCEGKIAKLHAMWREAGDGHLLPRAFAVELAVESGVNPSTARTQYQVWFRQVHSGANANPGSWQPDYDDPARARRVVSAAIPTAAPTSGLTEATK